ncbi:unnamed protein product, partial [Ectocarpus sp. 12 AP-2014]
MEDISSGANCFFSPLKDTSIVGFPPGPATTLKGQCFLSEATAGSVNLRPISRLASKTVLVAFIATWFLAAS